VTPGVYSLHLYSLHLRFLFGAFGTSDLASSDPDPDLELEAWLLDSLLLEEELEDCDEDSSLL
jgi:hypothetical protein